MGVSNSLPQVLWNTFGAVPVLPLGLKLKVFSVLVKDRGSFSVIGDLGSLCAEGESKAFLQNILAQEDERYITVSEEPGSINQTASHDSRWSNRLLTFQAGHAAALNDVFKWKITVPSHQLVSAAEGSLDKLLEKFIPDNGNPHFRRGKAQTVWIVTEVITAPSMDMYAFNKKGANVRFHLPPLAPVPADVQISLGGEVGAQQFISIRGSQVGDTVRPFALAFRGWKYKYENGFLKKPRRARYEADSFHAPPLNGAVGRHFRNVKHASPLDDPDMADFVREGEWFTTILDDEEPT